MRRLDPTVRQALDRIAEAEAAEPVDLALARLVAGLDAEHADRDPDRARTLALSAALVSRARRDGDSAVTLADHAGRVFPEDAHARGGFRGLPALPDLDVWRRHLDASPTVGGPDAATPLVWEPGPGRLSMRRFVSAEGRVARALADRLSAASVPDGDGPSTASGPGTGSGDAPAAASGPGPSGGADVRGPAASGRDADAAGGTGPTAASGPGDPVAETAGDGPTAASGRDAGASRDGGNGGAARGPDPGPDDAPPAASGSADGAGTGGPAAASGAALAGAPAASGPVPNGPTPTASGPSPAARDAFAALFPARADGALDRQALAAAAALRRRALFVAGGPGTGKTYTAARLLALALADAPATRVALAAPTGKAAGRLSESIAEALGELGALGGPVPTEAVTLHRLLGASVHRPGFRHDARSPLPHDLVLVDEGSMIDLPLFDALLAALKPGARLVVLGDPDQLAPVEAGTPFADVCALARGAAPPALAAFCDALGLPGVPSDPAASGLDAAVVRLTESRRFTADSDVGALAAAIQADDPAGTLAALDDADRPDVSLPGGDPAAAALAWVLPFAKATLAEPTPRGALAALDRFRLLAAVRRGPRGVEGLNAAVESALRAEGVVRWAPYAPVFYSGRPVLVTVNDHELDLKNGDVGVCWRGEAGDVVVFAERTVPYDRLPAHEPAWALTVHKSQGSEFDAVGAVLPEPETRGAGLLTRELLYTAATRAKASVALFGGRDQVEAAVAHRQRRTSGLADRLTAALAGGRPDGR